MAFPAYQPHQFTMFGQPSAFWDPFVRYDSGWYLGIARTGYDSATAIAGGRGNIAFFPVYPLLMRYVGRAFGRAPSDFFFGGILVAWISFVLAAIALFYLARLDLPRRQAERAVLLAAIFPFAFFFGVAYSESTYLLFTVLSFYLFRTRRWLLGGVCGAVATATRVNGIMMWPALAWIAWRTRRTDRTRSPLGGGRTRAGGVRIRIRIASTSTMRPAIPSCGPPRSAGGTITPAARRGRRRCA